MSRALVVGPKLITDLSKACNMPHATRLFQFLLNVSFEYCSHWEVPDERQFLGYSFDEKFKTAHLANA